MWSVTDQARASHPNTMDNSMAVAPLLSPTWVHVPADSSPKLEAAPSSINRPHQRSAEARAHLSKAMPADSLSSS